MKSISIKVALGVFAVTLYIASPFVSAWFIREAVRNGNSDYLARAVEWPERARDAETLDRPYRSEFARPRGTTAGEFRALAAPQDNCRTRRRRSPRRHVRHAGRPAEAIHTTQNLSRLYCQTMPMKPRRRRCSKGSSAPGRASNAPSLPASRHSRSTWRTSKIRRASISASSKLTPLGWKLAELRIKFLTAAKNTNEKSTAVENAL